MDHSKYVPQFLDAGIKVIAPPDVFTLHEREQHNMAIPLIPGQGYKSGGFRIIPFPVHHDVPCYGYVIDHPDSGRILFLTDTYMTEYTIPELSHIIIECNYADDILMDNIESGRVHSAMRPRLIKSHMELNTCIQTLLEHDLSRVINIVLVHLSDVNSHADRFQQEVSAATGKPVHVADKNMKIDFKDNPF
jgi:ribonuclease BN (tRNA processing enzyme)